jgi:hypothetical protein
MSGYARVHRTLLGHSAFRNEGEAMAFAWFVIKAAWRPTKVRYKDRQILLQRGQVAVSQRDMARALDRDKAWCARLIQRLKSEAMIDVTTEAGVSVVSISNYNKYQTERPSSEAAGEAPREAAFEAGVRQGRGTEQEREEDNKQNTGARLLPDDWEPNEFGSTSQSRAVVDGWSRVEFERQVEAFQAHHRLKRNKFDDWQAAWAKWVLNSVKFADRDEHRDRGRHQGSGGKSNDLVEIILAEHGLDEHGQPRKPKS